jgi:phosphatidylglycerol:prolipoprotein diacylglycerol transferase
MRPVLFYLPGDIPVYSYGIMLGLSCVLGAHLAVYLAERAGIDSKRAWWFMLTVIVCGIAGGRLHELWVQGKLFSSATLEVTHSGRTAYGGFLFGTLAGVLFARFTKMSFWRFADAVAPTLALGLGLTRIGCFLYGCDYGVRSDAWGVVFPPGSPASEDHVEANLLSVLPDGSLPPSLPVLPAQLFASAVGFVLFGVLLWAWFRRPRREGSVFLLFAACYGVARAGLEALRSDEGRGELLGLSTSTTIGILTASLAVALMVVPALKALRAEAGEVLPPPAKDGAAKG